MSRIVLVAVALIAAICTSSALAADLPYGSRQPYTVAQPLNMYSWAGPYIGGNLGWNWGGVDNNPTRILASRHFRRQGIPVVFMAVSAHGNAKTSPLAGRNAPTFVALQGWLEQTIADNPHLREKLAPAKLPAAISKAPPVAGPATVDAKIDLPGQVVSQPLTPPVAAKTPPAPVVEDPADEFSGQWFNRTFHPMRK